jgi:hypothetical protein
MSAEWRLSRFAGQTGFDLVLADDAETADLVYRFRYHVYVTLMGRRQLHADHARKTVREPLDERGLNFIAIKDGTVIGTIRRNQLDDPATRYYAKVYRADLFDPAPASRTSITTKLMVLPEYQNSTYPIRLVERFATFGYQHGITINLIDCNKPLIDLFERLGYFSYAGWIFHKEFGTVMPMFLAMDALDYLSRIRSVIYRANDGIVQDGCHGGYDVVRRLAQAPRNPTIRTISQPFRTMLDAAEKPALCLDSVRHDVWLDPVGGG